jgi:tetratricopeptide (TPR) repeat protein
VRASLVLLVTATVTALAGLDGGSYAVASRQTLSVCVWVLIAVGLILIPPTRLTRAVAVPPVIFAVFAVWTGASLAWSSSAEIALNEFHRVVLLLGVFLLPLVLLERRDVRFVAAGLATGITTVAFAGLLPRLFPGELGRHVGDMAVGGPRLSYPVGYWNGLGILVALGLALLLAEAGRPGAAWRRALAAAPIPALVSVLYLTSSRTAVAAVGVSLIALLAMSPFRWSLAATYGLCGAAATLTLVLLARHSHLVNAPAARDAAEEGRSFAVLLGAVSVVLALLIAAAARVRVRRSVDRRAGWALVGATVLLLAVGLGASNPDERFAAFREPPETFSVPRNDYIRAHLASAHGRGRWQMWQAAVQEFRDHPVLGGGAGSYAAWWARRGTAALFVLDAHSLYLETLGELGIPGLLLLSGFIASVLAFVVVRGLALEPLERSDTAAMLAVGIGFFAAAGLDWMWELTAVSAVAMLAVGSALLMVAPRPAERHPSAFLRWRWLGVCAALAVAGTAAVPLLAARELERSRAAARAGDLPSALRAASAARAIEPWAASGHLQVALVLERARMLGAARRSVRRALDADPDDWRIWLVAARLSVKAGAPDDARRDLARAAALNPRSPLFSNIHADELGVAP